jgi:hypothetical protein
MTPDDTSQNPHAGQDMQAGEPFGPFKPERPRRSGFGPRHVLFAGVAGACVLGVGLGLWARPGQAERRMAIAAPEASAPTVDPAAHKLRIVLDDHSAPVNAPIEGLATSATPPGPVATPLAATFASAPPSSVQAAPPLAARAAPPVLHVQTPLPAIVPPMAQPAAQPAMTLPKLTPVMVAALAEVRNLQTKLSKPIPPLVRLPSPPPVELAKADPPPAPAPKVTPKVVPKAAPKPAHAIQLAQAAADHAAAAHAAQAATARAQAQKLAAAAHRIELAKGAQAEKAQKAEIQKAKFEKTAADRLEKAHLAKAEQAEELKLAKAEARGRAEAQAEARAEAVAEAREEARKQIRLASLARVVRQILPQHAAKPAPPVETARNDRRHKGRHDAVMEQASLKAHRTPSHAAPPPARSAPAPVIPPPHASGLVKVSTPRCASRDPGDALVCADPSLGAADRQLSRAYQGARAAGVPEIQLQRQQQQWLAARAAAAREAPWAVHDVYLARIAELNSLARDAHGDGY